MQPYSLPADGQHGGNNEAGAGAVEDCGKQRKMFCPCRGFTEALEEVDQPEQEAQDAGAGKADRGIDHVIFERDWWAHLVVSSHISDRMAD